MGDTKKLFYKKITLQKLFSMQLYIIGNGFDMDLGIDSSYNSYFRSKHFEVLCKSSPIAMFVKKLNDKNNGENWVDFEEAIKLYCIDLLHKEELSDIEKTIKYQNRRDFENHFNEIRKSISEFLTEEASKIDLSSLQKEKKSLIIAKEIIERFHETSNKGGGLITENNNFKVITFNYTNSLKELIKIEAKKIWIGDKQFINNIEKLEDNVIHIHGSLVKNDIILGIEDVPDIVPKETFFIRKSIFVDYSKFSLELMRKANNVTIFGHSLGTSDEMYFKKLFNLWKQNASSYEKRKIIIYHKKDPKQKVYYNNRILELIDYTTSEFKELNEYKFIEVT
jgi:hypothetical protein